MRILLIEDNQALAELLHQALVEKGYTVDHCDEGDDGLRWIRERAHDLVILDRMLPNLDGLTALTAARRDGVNTPVLLMTALGTTSQVVEGFDCGADDYIVKPFALEELLARVGALVRRPRGLESPGSLTAGRLQLDLENKELRCGDQSCSLSKRECDLLELFLRNPDKTLTRSSIFSYVWGPDAPVEETNLDNYIYFVRQRLAEVDSPHGIKTVRGIGYRMER